MSAVMIRKRTMFVPNEAKDYHCQMMSVGLDDYMLNIYNLGYYRSDNSGGTTHQYRELKSYLAAIGVDHQYITNVDDLMKTVSKHLNKPVFASFHSEKGYDIDCHGFKSI